MYFQKEDLIKIEFNIIIVWFQERAQIIVM